MSRDFTKNTSNFMRCSAGLIGAAVNGAPAISFHCRVNIDTLSTGNNADNRLLQSILDGSSVSGLFISIDATGTPTTLKVAGRSQAADGFQQVSSGNIPTGAWVSLGGVLDFANDRIRVYVNGVEVADGAVTFGSSTYINGSPSASDGVFGGASSQHTSARQLDGRGAEWALWPVDIGASAYKSLNSGVAAHRVSAPAVYLPIFGVDSPEPDFSGNGISGTISGTVSQEDHVPAQPHFGFDLGWQGNSTEPAGNNNGAALYYHFINTGVYA